jgi:hypothetical protein
MKRRLLTLTIAIGAAAALAVPAAGDGGGASPGVDLLAGGVLAPNGKTRYVAIPDGSRTVVAQILVRNGFVLRTLTVPGHFGLPFVANDGTVGGLSFDGRVLVLAAYGGPVWPSSRFAVVDIKRWRPGKMVRLRGNFSVDALSPKGRMLYLIEHTSLTASYRYRVRAYDLGFDRLVPGAIVDRRVADELMAGNPLARAVSPGGTWVYTLYQRPAGAWFIHALDTRRAEAICIDLPRKPTTSWRYGATLGISRDGAQLLLRPFPSQRLAAVVSTRTFGVTLV